MHLDTWPMAATSVQSVSAYEQDRIGGASAARLTLTRIGRLISVLPVSDVRLYGSRT